MFRVAGVLLQKIKRRYIQAYHEHKVALSFRHVSGLRRLSLSEDDVVVVCLIKNGYFFIEYFLTYYQKLGISHFVFVDNGSTDGTIALLAGRQNVTVIRSMLPAKYYESDLRRQAIRKFALGHWCLCVDSDELFDYQHSDKIPLKGLIGYLKSNGYSCVVAQMLDMFSENSLNSPAPNPQSDLESRYQFYDLSSIDAFDYHSCALAGLDYFARENTIGSADIKWLFGGIRRAHFNAYVCLTKHPLFLVSSSMIPAAHPHCSSRVSCADFSTLIRHYKFAGNFHVRIRSEVKDNAWETGDGERYLRALQGPNLHLMRDTSRRYSAIDDLVKSGFLIGSATYDRWVDNFASWQNGIPFHVDEASNTPTS
jgi:hypothetical protein